MIKNKNKVRILIIKHFMDNNKIKIINIDWALLLFK